MVAYYWLRRKVRAIHTIVLLWLFLQLGKKLYAYAYMHDNNYGRCTAILFAQSEREATITVRTFVEWLDEQGK